MSFTQQLATQLFGKEIQRRIQQAVSERDELWAIAVHDSFYREGGHPMIGGTVFEWSPIRLPGGILFEPNWGMIWRHALDTPYRCPVHVVSEAELHLKVLDIFRPEEDEEDKDD